jgi:hypothetical protein
MFKKSLKYEMKASSRLLVPLFISVIAMSALVAVGLAGLNAFDELAKENETVAIVAENILGFMIVAFVALIVASSITVFVLMVRRFYTSFFTDEGYLTFTLPVTVDCHLGVKTVAMMIWYAVCDAVILVSCGIFALGIFVIVPDSFVIDEATLRMIMESVGENFGGSLWMSIVMGIVSGLASYFLLFLSISIGCMLTKKHRFITCAVCYFVANSIVGNITSLVTTLVTVSFNAMGNLSASAVDLMYMTIMLITTVVYAVLGVGCYFGTRYILKNKVNLD